MQSQEVVNFDQLRRLICFFEPITDHKTNAERFIQYIETWTELQGESGVQHEMWNAQTDVHYAYRGDRVFFWKSLAARINRQFTTAISESPFDDLLYNHLLKRDVDKLLMSLDAYSAMLELQGSETAEIAVREAGKSTARSFMDLILFLFAVQQRSQDSDEWDVIEEGDHFEVMINACKFYQDQKDLMTFLGDCAVVVLLTCHFNLPPEIESIIAKYKVLLNTMEETHSQYFSISDETLAKIKIIDEKGVVNLRPCVVCMDKTRDVILMPCAHCAVCHECVIALCKCPMCRKPITSIDSVKNRVGPDDVIRAPAFHNTQLPKASIFTSTPETFQVGRVTPQPDRTPTCVTDLLYLLQSTFNPNTKPNRCPVAQRVAKKAEELLCDLKIQKAD